MSRAKGSGSVFPLCAEKYGCPPKVDKVRPEHKCKAPWRGQVEAGFTASGARRYITVTGKSQKDAATKLRSKINEIAEHGTPRARAGTVTVRKWSDEWLPLYRKHVSPNRWTDARGVTTKYIVPTIGHKRLVSLTPPDVRSVHAAVENAGFSLYTQLRAHDVLMVMLKAAIQDGHRVPSNVLTTKRPQTPDSDGRDAMPDDDAIAVLTLVGKMPDRSRWIAAFLQATRSGERRGLTWDRVDFDRRLIDFSWQLQELPYLDKKDRSLGFRVPDGYRHKQLIGRMHLVRPKTRKSKRVLPMVPWLYDALVEWRKVAPANPYGLVWTLEGKPISKHDELDAWHALQDAAGVEYADEDDGSTRKYTLHEVRHTTATLLLRAKVDPHVVTSIMGHTKITTSRGYQHVNHDMEMAALEQVAAILQIES